MKMQNGRFGKAKIQLRKCNNNLETAERIIRKEYMNTRKSLYDIKSFYNKKAVLKASYEGMRYQIEQAAEGEEIFLLVTVWPEPFCFEKTAEEKKQQKSFGYSEDGLDEAYDWLCMKYEEEKLRWEHARDFPLDGLLS